MTGINVIKVGWDGKDALGEDYTLIAAPEAVARGYMVNVPALIQYPNGKIATGNHAKITPAGLEVLKREMPVEHRTPEGSA